jgi:transcriptional regulator with XRE-family HTH domain
MVNYNSIEKKLILARKLRALRLAKDLKQAETANLLGLKSQQQYSKLENGQSEFTNTIIKRICSVFEINELSLVNPEDIRLPRDKEKFIKKNIRDNDYIISELIKSKNEIIKSLKKEITILKKRNNRHA